MRSTLFEKLANRPGFSRLDASNFEQVKQQSGYLMLFCTGDPLQRPESLDLSVILPELSQAFAGQFRVGVVASDMEEKVQQWYGIQQWPCLVLLRDGEYVGSISRLRDWAEYLQEIANLLKRSASQGKDLNAFIITQPQGCA